MKKKMLFLLRMALLAILLIAALPLYFRIAPDTPWPHVKEITEDTIRELSETDEMYNTLPDYAAVVEVWVNHQLGDGYVNVNVEVPVEKIDPFVKWLNKDSSLYTQRENIFSFSYFISDSHLNFGELENEGDGSFSKIYWTVVACIFIMLIIPWGMFMKE